MPGEAGKNLTSPGLGEKQGKGGGHSLSVEGVQERTRMKAD